MRQIVAGLSAVLLTALLSGCSVLPSLIRSQPQTTHGPQEQPIIRPHQAFRSVYVCADISSSVSSRFLHQFLHPLADAIDRAVVPNSDGAIFIVHWIGANSWTPDADALTITIPAIQADPLPPKSRSYPVATGDPFAEAQAHQSVDEANTNAQAQYQQQLHRLHTHLAKVRAAVHQQTQRLRSLTWPIDAIQTDVFGCVERASLYFTHAHGTKVLLIASDLINNTFDEYVSGSMHLTGVKVKIAWYCADAPVCMSVEAQWRQFLRDAGAQSVEFYDPVQIQTLPDLLA